jgi:Tfp pilus assembly protein FimT
LLALPSKKGMTLVELLVILSITAILVTLSIPLFTSYVQKRRLVGVTENLYSFLQYARSEAVKRNANVYVSFVTGDNWCYGMNAGSACNCSVANNCGLGTTSAEQTHVLNLTTSGLASNSIYFEGTHGAANASGTVTFTIYNQSPYIKITIGRLGSLQTCANDVSGYQGC